MKNKNETQNIFDMVAALLAGTHWQTVESDEQIREKTIPAVINIRPIGDTGPGMALLISDVYPYATVGVSEMNAQVQYGSDEYWIEFEGEVMSFTEAKKFFGELLSQVEDMQDDDDWVDEFSEDEES